MSEQKTKPSDADVMVMAAARKRWAELPCLDVGHFVPSLRYSRQRRACKLAALKQAGP